MTNEEQEHKSLPFDFGIKKFKQTLDHMNVSKAYKNKAIKMYKKQLYTRVEETKKKMIAGL